MERLAALMSPLFCWAGACELEELRGQRRLLRVVLPRGVAGDRAPLFNGRLVDLGALLGIDVGDFLIVGHGLRGAELFHFDAERHNYVLLVLRQRVEGLLRHDKRL